MAIEIVDLIHRKMGISYISMGIYSWFMIAIEIYDSDIEAMAQSK